MLAGRTYWLVGASEGLGRALAEQLDREGVNLVLSARSDDRLQELSGTLNRPARIVPCDVSSAESVTAAWQSVGQIDGIVYLAGLYEPTRAQDWNAQQVEAMCDVNFIGAIRVLGLAVPSFVSRGSGHIVIIGSLAGYRGLPGAIGYGASKAGLMHLAENLQAELWQTDIRVQLFNPGFIRTRLTDKNSFSMPFLMDSDQAAAEVCRGMKSRSYKIDFPWMFSLVFRLGRLLPTSIFLRLISRG